MIESKIDRLVCASRSYKTREEVSLNRQKMERGLNLRQLAHGALRAHLHSTSESNSLVVPFCTLRLHLQRYPIELYELC